MNYNNIATSSHLVYERQQLLFRFALFVVGSVITLLVLFQLLRPNQDYIIAEPSSVFHELANSVYDLITLELSTTQPTVPMPLVTDVIPEISMPVEPVSITNTSAEKLNNPKIQNTNWHTVTIKHGQSLSNIASQLKIKNTDLKTILTLPQAYSLLRHLIPGHKLVIESTSDGAIAKLNYFLDKDRTLIINRIGAHFTSELQEKDSLERLLFASTVIHRSLIDSLHKAGFPSQTSRQINTMLGNNIHPGDRINFLYQESFNNGRAVHSGPIIAAKLFDHGKVYTLIRFTDTNGKAGYFTPTGQSLTPGFLRAPVHYTRISSLFNLHRRQPILGIIRPHYGVDFAAHYGSPVVATGNGRIAFLGRKSGFGRTIEIRHDRTYATLYAHLAQFAHGIHNGSTITAGQVIGFVGMSGLATGPHLHYEIHINGKPYDPLHVKIPSTTFISKKQRPLFLRYADAVVARLEGKSVVV
jgi:murein DD-endopeptidase MepM/ murein hydrolase activator NlpD